MWASNNLWKFFKWRMTRFQKFTDQLKIKQTSNINVETLKYKDGVQNVAVHVKKRFDKKKQKKGINGKTKKASKS